MVWVNPNEPFPEESPRSALSDRSWAHVVHNVEPTRHALSDRMLAHVRDRNRARELEMVASHANVAELNLPPDMIALAYDRNNGDLVDAIMDLTEPIFRRQLEHELAERQAEARMVSERDDQERARNGLRYTMERFRRFVTSARVEEEEEEEQEEEEEEPDQRELDLWLLESQVPGCTRERAERAYAQGREDVTRALPLARMATLLADRDAMVNFLMEMQPGGLRAHAEDCYDETEGDIVDAVVDYHRRTALSRNEEPMRDRCLHRLRIRTVFALALIYRERYGQLQPEAKAFPNGMKALGGNLFAATSESGEPIPMETADGLVLKQGFVEGSNVDIAEELISMIMAQRSFEVTSKAVESADETMQTVNQMKR